MFLVSCCCNMFFFSNFQFRRKKKTEQSTFITHKHRHHMITKKKRTQGPEKEIKQHTMGKQPRTQTSHQRVTHFVVWWGRYLSNKQNKNVQLYNNHPKTWIPEKKVKIIKWKTFFFYKNWHSNTIEYHTKFTPKNDKRKTLQSFQRIKSQITTKILNE